ncbi:dihydrolipoyl dehydrogenase [Roseomonas sp. AR75]|uniref:dihydrolipoyl dehydrogenase n=1 Tax=Roseomonas sp. AR75 TaxID=2562311 RepID=UPI0010C0450B|nr:dihydrolipoyl dehydrogenase [Roseomonas sp. AR75]
MQVIETDVAVIGAGTAGLNARRAALERGARVVLVESGPFGTTCARVGCMPSKLLIAAADAAQSARDAAVFGIHAAPSIDGRAVMARVQRERDRYVAGTVKGIEAIPPEQFLHGRARFLGPDRLAVGEATELRARSIVVATGSVPFVPEPFDRAQVLTSDEIFELAELPDSLAVIGTGVIALELGQAMHRLGVRTAFFSPFDELGPLSDPEVIAVVRRDLGAELDLRLKREMLAAEPGADGTTLRWREPDGKERTERFARVLVAAGRRPQVAGLGLEATGLALGRHGVPESDPETGQCGASSIFFAGDVAGHRALQHEAADEGRIVGDNAALFPAVTRHDRRTALAIAFTDPQMAMVGLRHEELDPAKHAIGAASYDDQGRARAMAVNRGLLRVYAARDDGRIVGAEMFGPAMEHIGQLIAWAVEQRLCVPAALAMPYYHPVLETGLRTALRGLAKQLDMTRACRPEDLEESPGR